MSTLPIEAILTDVRASLEQTPNLVIQAPPGAGKTTMVPLALLDAPWRQGGRIIVLEPRRIAARAAAARMAELHGEGVGKTIGYRTRLDTRVSKDTCIEVVTEGVYTRMLQSDPELPGIAAVIFDEFHERSLQTDLGLALSLETQGALRDDLRLLVMSATLDGGPVAALLGDAPVVTSEGRSYPVETRYRGGAGRADRVDTGLVAQVVAEALTADEGDLLVFLPGVGEIRRVQEQLEGARPGHDVRLLSLHGSLTAEQQDAALGPAGPGTRKVVLATSIAETSLTIEGTRVVIDAGRMRVPRFDPNSGMTRLVTLRVSRASADQRRGRAGRLGPGICYRLWDESTDASLVPFTAPEIREADLSPLVLELARWGTRDPASLAWLDTPPAAGVEQARTLLQELDALDAKGMPSAHGEAMARLPLAPRLAHMVLQGKALGQGALACHLAALLGERDPLQGEGGRQVDVQLRLSLLAQVRSRGPAQRIRQSARQLARSVKVGDEPWDPPKAGVLLALAYPDRVAQRRAQGHGRFRLANGRGAWLPEEDPLAAAPLLAVASLDGDRREAKVFLAAELEQETLEECFEGHIHTVDEIRWDVGAGRVTARRERRFGALVLDSQVIADPDPDAVARALLDGIQSAGLDSLPWNRDLSAWRARLQFLHRVDPDSGWPDLSDAVLLNTMDEWLLPFLVGKDRIGQLRGDELKSALSATLDWSLGQRLEEWAPTHWTVPSGTRVRLDYDSGDTPVLAVRLQEMFGCRQTPAIAGGRVALMIHLLSPARRPVQVTRDLASFWANTYEEVRKDLRGRYPRHHWPDDPLNAEPTRRTKRSGG